MTLHEESIARMQALKAGDPVTNICAGDNNPCLHSRFVAYVVKPYKNKYGVVHRDHWAKCKDKNGHISNIGIDVIYLGHLDAETRAKWLLQVKAGHDAQAATVLLSATEITESAYDKLKGEL